LEPEPEPEPEEEEEEAEEEEPLSMVNDYFATFFDRKKSARVED
jgi:hypothetical protein